MFPLNLQKNMLKNLLVSLYGIIPISLLEALTKFDNIMSKSLQILIGVLTVALLIYKIRNEHLKSRKRITPTKKN